MLATFVRVIILYILVLVIMRLMGKREIGQLQPFELAIAIMIADLASVPMADIGIPLSSRNNTNFSSTCNATFNFAYKFKKHKNKRNY